MTSRILLSATILASFVLTAGAFAANPTAAQSVTRACATQYKADKAAGTVPTGQTWSQYLSNCSKTQAAAPVATTAEPTEKSPPEPIGHPSKFSTKGKTPGQIAMHKRIVACGEKWRADKAAGKTAGQTWPKYWSACNTRMKAAGK